MSIITAESSTPGKQISSQTSLIYGSTNGHRLMRTPSNHQWLPRILIL